MPSDKNKQIIADLRGKISKAKSIIVADYAGLGSNDINSLRSSMKTNNAEVAIAKNTLMKIALREEKIQTDQLEADLEGTTAVVFTYKDPVAPIKALFDFIKKVELPKVKAAIFDGKYSNAEQVAIISALPGREQLIAQVVGGLKSPLVGIVGVLNGVQRKFVYALSAIAEKKQ